MFKQTPWRPLLPALTALLLLWGFLWVFTKSAVRAESTTPDSPGALTGLVVNEAGTPLVGITVALFRNVNQEPIYTLLTDPQGRYHFKLLPAGLYYLKFSDPSAQYAFQFYRQALLNTQAEAIIVAGTTVTADNVTLAAGGRITGTITLTGGISYPEGQLELLHKTATGWQQVTATRLVSGAQEYRLAGLPAGRYRLCIAAIECYANVAYDYDYERATDLVVTAGQTISNINFVLGDGADRAGISGQIMGQSMWGVQRALPNIIVQLWRQSPERPNTYFYDKTAYSNGEGRYQINDLLPGVYKVAFSDPAYHYAPYYYHQTTQWLAAQPLTLTLQERRQGIDATLLPGGWLIGRVSAAGEAAHRGRVYLYQEGQISPGYEQVARAEIDATGHYTFTGLATGPYRLLAEAYVGGAYINDYDIAKLATAHSVTVTVGLTATYELALRLRPDLFDGSITGTVSSAGTPLAGIKVEAYAGNNGAVTGPVVYTYTDQQGHYAFAGLSNGEYYLRAVDPTGDYAFSWHNFTWFPDVTRPLVISGATTLRHINIGLLPGAAISGRILQPDGAPAPNATVELCVLFSNFWRCSYLSTQTDSAGYYAFRGLPAITYRLSAQLWTPVFYPIKFYPFSTSVYEAADIPLQPGSNRPGVDLVLGPNRQIFLPIIR